MKMSSDDDDLPKVLPPDHDMRKKKGKVAKINPELLCQICENLYTKPKLLDCMHSFCLPCLTKLLTNPEPANAQANPNLNQANPRVVQQAVPPKSYIGCPTCQENTEINTFVDDLCTNIILQNEIEVLKSKENGGPICTECEKDSVTFYCEDCESSMCELCCESHRRQVRRFAGHNIKSSQEVPYDQLIKKPKEICKERGHGNANCLYFCSKCLEHICQHCMDDHKDHGAKLYAKFLKEKKEEVDEKIKKGTEASAIIKSFLGVSEQMLQSTATQKVVSIQNINTAFKKLEDMLTVQKQMLINQVNDNYQTGKASLDKAREQEKKFQSLLEYSTKASEVADKSENSEEMAKLVNYLEKHFKTLGIDAVDNNPIAIPPDAYIRINQNNNVFDMVTTYFSGKKGNIKVDIQKKTATFKDPQLQNYTAGVKNYMSFYAQT